MSTDAAKQKVASHILQHLRTLRSGNDPEIAIAAAEAERDFMKSQAPPLGAARRRRTAGARQKASA